MRKTKHNNNVTDRTSVVYAQTKTKLLGPVWLGVVYDETR